MQVSFEPLVKELAALCLRKNIQISVAESCTGGMLAAALTSIAGSSVWFDRGFVTYANAAKVEMLGVLPQTLAEYGAVSEQTVREMAVGCVANSHSHFATAITGIAGPDGGSVDKPVGTVWIGFAMQGEVQTVHEVFSGDRDAVRMQAANAALGGLIELINSN